jgi:hypothetical protein
VAHLDHVVGRLPQSIVLQVVLMFHLQPLQLWQVCGR